MRDKIQARFTVSAWRFMRCHREFSLPEIRRAMDSSQFSAFVGRYCSILTDNEFLQRFYRADGEPAYRLLEGMAGEIAPEVCLAKGRLRSGIRTGAAQSALWGIMREGGEFTFNTLIERAADMGIEINERVAQNFITHLKKHGYLKMVRDVVRGSAREPAIYRLSLDTGALPPALCAGGKVWDRNTKEYAEAAA